MVIGRGMHRLSCVLVWNPRQVGTLSSQMMEQEGEQAWTRSPSMVPDASPSLPREFLSLQLGTHMDGMGIPRSGAQWTWVSLPAWWITLLKTQLRYFPLLFLPYPASVPSS